MPSVGPTAQIDAFFWVGGLPTAAVTDLANSPGMKLVMIDHAEQVQAMNKKYGAHLYIIHGDADDRVPIQHSRDFAKLKGASLMEIPGADHFEVINPESIAFELILQLLKK